jgi:type III secretion system needle length determinant
MQNKTRIPDSTTNVQHDKSDNRTKSNKQNNADIEFNPNQKNKELSLFRKLMHKQPTLKGELSAETPLRDNTKKPDKESIEKDSFIPGKYLPTEHLKDEPLNEEVRLPSQGDQILKTMLGLKQTNTMNSANETITKLTELVQDLVKKMWVGQPGKINQNSLTMKLDSALLPNTTITLVHNNGQLNVHLATPSEASYQLLISQQRQLISRLDKRKFTEKLNVTVTLTPHKQINVGDNPKR